MAFTIGSGTFTNGSATVTGVTLTSGTLAYFASGTRMVVGVNPVIQEVEAIAAPTVSTITLRSAWTGTGGTYSFLANQTSEGLRDAVQAIRTNNASLQSFIDSIDTAATADSVAQRTSDGSLNAVNVYASGNLGVGTNAAGLATAGAQFVISKSGAQAFEFSPNGSAAGKNRLLSFDRVAIAEYPLQVRASSIEFSTNNTERLRIDSSGNVGIGTSSIGSAGLSLLNSYNISFSEGSNSSFVNLFRQSSSGATVLANGYKYTSTAGGFASSYSDTWAKSAISLNYGNVIFYTNTATATASGTDVTPTERMIITSSGNVGIGTSSPSAKLEVRNDVSAATDLDPTSIKLYNNFDGGSAIEFSNSVAGKSKISFGVTGTGGSTDDTYIGFSTGANAALSERMRIDSSGNLLVGKTATGTADGVSLFGTGAIRSDRTSAACLDLNRKTSDGELVRLYKDGTQVGSIGVNSGNLTISTNNTERMRINSSGMVLVGTTSGSFGAKITAQNETSYTFESRRTGTGSEGQIAFVNGNGAVGSIFTNGTSTSYNTSSDYRLKEDWQPMDCACDRVMQLNPVNFAWKADGKRVDGFLAHELAEVIPEAVTGEKDETRIEEYEVEPAVYEDVVIPAEFDEDGNEISPERTEQRLVSEAVMGEREVPVYQGIDQSKVVPLLTAALQHALKDIADLKARIEALEG